MEFGPEIKVDGVRPEWLGSYDGPLGYERDGYGWYGPFEGQPEFWTEKDIISSRDGWRSIMAIRLPADHPHYATPTPDERAVAPELVERMEDLVRRIAKCSLGGWCDEARAIVAALEPVDGDLVEARRMAKATAQALGMVSWTVDGLEKGEGDDTEIVKLSLSSIKRGRQLEKEGK